MAATFWLTLAAGVGVLAASGHCMTAQWAFAPVCGFGFWRVIVTSPEVLIFLFFMITDPKTVPAGRVGRVVFGVLVAVASTLLMAPQTNEFGDQGRAARRARRRVRGPSGARPAAACTRFGRRPDRCLRHPAGDRGSRRCPPAAAESACSWPPWSSSVSASSPGVPGPRHDRRPDRWRPRRGQARRLDPTTFPTITVDQDVADWNHEIAGPVAQRPRARPGREPGAGEPGAARGRTRRSCRPSTMATGWMRCGKEWTRPA